MGRWGVWVALIACVACGGGGATDGTPSGTSAGTPGGGTGTGTGTGTGGTASGDCADPSFNPFAGTCVETFLADCFDPAGTCDGTADMMGNTVLTWENGASIETTVSFPDITTVLTASDGTECARGTTEVNAGACFSRTTYQRSSDGAQQVWCIQADGSMTVTCSDGTELSFTPAESEQASACGFGGDGAEPCTVEMTF